ncbi:MAG: hypothetical protein JXB85_15475 [Anaerolineales bacterium]|nr:hypothetical protein [Anaerolineales bacterium]
MFDPNSRYAKIPTASLTEPGGREIVYVRRRFLPRADDLATLVELTVTQGDRLDLACARALGDPEQFWRACDASNAMHPSELTGQSSQTIRFPIPQPQ